MSRSIKKHLISGVLGNNRKSMKEWKTFANRFNRRKAKLRIKRGCYSAIKYKKICSWDWDLCKYYFSERDLDTFPKVRRK